MNDIELVVNNSRIFNGLLHPITKKAEEIKANLKRLLEHDRNTLGIERCPLRNFEECIRKKFTYLNRDMPTFVPVVVYQPKVAPRPDAPTGKTGSLLPPPAATQAVIPAHIGLPAPSLPAWALAKQASSQSLQAAGSPRAGAGAAAAAFPPAAATATATATAAAAAVASAPAASAAATATATAVPAAAGAGTLSASASAAELNSQAQAQAPAQAQGEDQGGLLAMDEAEEDAAAGGDPIVTEFF